LAILSCIAVVIEYAETMLFPAIPNIIKDFKITYDTSSWILSGYLITAAVIAPIAGKLSDMYGKKKVLLIIMTIFIISIAAAGFSINISFLILSRVIQGIGLSMFIIALSILQSEVPKEKYALANGILASLYFSGSSIGLILGGGIVHYFDWRVTFFSLIPILGIIYVVVVKVLKVEEQKKHAFGSKMIDSPSSDTDTADASNNKEKDEISSSILPKNKIDIKGALALISGITFLLIALTYLEIGESSRSVSTSANFGICLVLLVVSAISIILFIRFEKTSASPLIDLSCYKQNHSPSCYYFHDYGTHNVYGLSDRASICDGSITHWFWRKCLDIIYYVTPIYNHIPGIVSSCK
jgi:MFS family permease